MNFSTDVSVWHSLYYMSWTVKCQETRQTLRFKIYILVLKATGVQDTCYTWSKISWSNMCCQCVVYSSQGFLHVATSINLCIVCALSFTLALAHGKSIPRVNNPNMGAPSMPNNDKAAWKWNKNRCIRIIWQIQTITPIYLI